MLPSSLLRARRRGRRTGGTITRSRRRILTLPLCFFTVDAGGVAIVTQFGDPVRVESAPGLHVKHPYPLQSVISLDRRLHILVPPPSASADRENKINEGRTYANNVLPKARGEAQSLVLAAQSYREQRVAEAVGNTSRFLELLAEYTKAPDITRSRLYLEAMERILPKVKKYVVDSEQGRQPVNLRLNPARP